MRTLSTIFLTCVLLGMVIMPVRAQVPPHRTCGTPEADSARRAAYPEAGSRAEFEEWMARTMATTPLTNRAVITIPVIVHVVHNGEPVGTGNNISADQVRSQMEVLNEDFRRIPGTPGANNNPVGADTEIEFCLATIDPAGQPLITPGVNRIDRNDMGWNNPPYSMAYADQTIKPATQWNPDDYLNIWVMPLSSGLLGFAQTPDASTLPDIPNIGGGAAADGVVIRPTSFGRVGNVNAPYDHGRTTTHEIGHWLGLLHVSGDGNCSVDDGCDDTPTTSAQNYGCPSGASSCGQVSMVENYMEYTDDVCMNVFTACQKARMLTVLTHSPRRKTLAQSNACTSEVPPAAWFNADAEVLCAGQSVQFHDLSPNGPTGWTWTFQGGFPSTSSDQHPLVQYSQPGTYEVSLTVVNSFGSTTLSQQGFITVNQAGPAGFFTENFESGIPAGWTVDNPDGALTWATRAVDGSLNGLQAAWVNCYQYSEKGQRDGLITSAIDLSYYTGVRLGFDHGYRRYADGSGTPSNDSLRVLASTDGGQTFPYLLAALGEDGSGNFATGADTVGLYIPKTDQDWCYAGANPNCLSIDLGAFDGESDLRLKFEVVNDYGNSIFLDNVILTGVCTVTPVDSGFDPVAVSLYPNPARDAVEMLLDSRQAGEGWLKVQNVQGQILLRESRQVVPGTQTWQLSLVNWPSGMYFVTWEMEGRRVSRKLIRE